MIDLPFRNSYRVVFQEVVMIGVFKVVPPKRIGISILRLGGTTLKTVPRIRISAFSNVHRNHSISLTLKGRSIIDRSSFQGFITVLWFL